MTLGPPGESVLILNTYSKSNKAVITDANGKEEYMDKDFSFTFGQDTEVYHSCSVTLRDELFIFGGMDDSRQITKLNGCKLERVGTLSFSHFAGACAVVNDNLFVLPFEISIL